MWYHCPRCGYKTERKNNMREHLYNKLKPCPGCKNTLELTDEIKEHILKNLRYKIPKEKKEPTPSQVINAEYTVKNYIASIDPITKLKKTLNYQGVSMTGFDTKIENKYEHVRERLDNDPDEFVLDHEKIIESIDMITKVHSSSVQDFNLLYDKKNDRILLYDDREDHYNKWRENTLSATTVAICNLMKEFYWDSYEQYLIRKINNPNVRVFEKTNTYKQLDEYYSFLSCLNIPPYVLDNIDGNIFHNDDTKTEVCKKFTDFYEKTKHKRTEEKIEWKKRIKKIQSAVKVNCKNNIHKLNEIILETTKVDEQFRHLFLAHVIKTNLLIEEKNLFI